MAVSRPVKKSDSTKSPVAASTSTSVATSATRSRFSNFTQTWIPEEYQVDAVEWLLSHNAAGLFADPGLGKTSIALSAFDQLNRDKVARRALVVAPLRVCELVWPAEAKKWKHLNRLRISNLAGSATPQKRLRSLESGAEILLVNPENIGWLFGEENLHLLHKYNLDTLIVDESTKFKAYNTVRFDLIRSAVDYFERRWILTGTPRPNGYMDLFGQIFIVDSGRALGKYITQYRNRFFVPSGYGGYDYKLQPGADERIEAAIAPYILRLDEKDYIDLPPIKENPIYVELPKDVRKIYDSMEADLVAELCDGKILAANAAAASTACRQITGGGLYRAVDRKTLSMPEQFEELHGEKLDALADLHESIGSSPLLVMYQFQHELYRLQKRFKKAKRMGATLRDDKANEAAWNRGEISMLFAHPASIAHGLNMQHGGNAVCWYSDTWNAEEYEQTLRRLRRRGTEHKTIFSHHLVARDTIDEVMLLVVAQKQRDQKTFLNAMKQYFNSDN